MIIKTTGNALKTHQKMILESMNEILLIKHEFLLRPSSGSFSLPAVPEQNYSESRYHFLHSSDGEGCAQMLVEYSASRGYRNEVDLFVAQAVLQ